MGKYSSSDSDYSRSSSTSSKRKKKKSRKRKSQSPARHSSKKSSRRRSKSRSRSRSDERGNGAHYRRRSRSRDRSRERSRDRHRHSARKSRSRSPDYRRKSHERSREKSSKRKKRSRDRSASPVTRRIKHVDAVMGVSTGTLKDVLDIVPGFSKMNPAEQSRIRIQRALKTAVETAKDEEKSDVIILKDDDVNVKTQIERNKEIEEIEGGSDSDDAMGFIPSHFKSSNKIKKKQKGYEAMKKSFNDAENTHEMAMFGHVTMLTLEEAVKRRKLADDEALQRAKKRVDFSERDPRTLVAPELLVSKEEADKRWLRKLASLRKRFAT